MFNAKETALFYKVSQEKTLIYSEINTLEERKINGDSFNCSQHVCVAKIISALYWKVSEAQVFFQNGQKLLAAYYSNTKSSMAN